MIETCKEMQGSVLQIDSAYFERVIGKGETLMPSFRKILAIKGRNGTM